MEILTPLVIGAIGVVVGFFVGRYFAVQPALVLGLGVPFVRKAMQAGLLNGVAPLRTYLLSAALLASTFALFSCAALLLLPQAFFVGYLCAVIFLLVDALRARLRNDASLKEDVVRVVGPHVGANKSADFARFTERFFLKG